MLARRLSARHSIPPTGCRDNPTNRLTSCTVLWPSYAPGWVWHRGVGCLGDPAGRIGQKLVALPPIELLGGADETQDAFLDEIEQRYGAALALLRDRNDEAQVGVDHPVLRALLATLD